MSESLALTPKLSRPDRKLDVVFVHGLGDNDIQAWQHKDQPATFWPSWLADDFAEIQVWMLRYPAPQFNFGKMAMAIPDRAAGILDFLIDKGVGQRDILFVAHSLGGIIVKQLLATSEMYADRRRGAIARATRGIVFLATPHMGSEYATWAERVGVASKLTEQLAKDDPWLRYLDEWFAKKSLSFGWDTRQFSETVPVGPMPVVSPSSASSRAGDAATPLDFDHVDTAKPVSKDGQIYVAIESLIKAHLTTPIPKRKRVPTANAPYLTVPPLPENYVERAGALGALRAAVTADRTSRSIGMIAVHGMGGLGKTILAQALCRDEVVQQAFIDGVVWITVGEVPRDDVAARLREVGKALGDDPAAYDGERAAQNRYRSVIRDKAALIVLDDVWSARDIEPFRAESPRSRLVFTTRDAGIASGTSAHLLTPDFLSPEESRAMLASWFGTSVDAMPPSADEVIRECGGLALAVATIGARLRVNKSLALWDVVLNQLRKADLGKLRQRFSDYPYPDVLGALKVSVDALEPEMRERYLALAVMLEDMPIHPLIQRVLWNADKFDALETADEFVRLALAQRMADGESIKLHDLLLDLVRRQYADPQALSLIHGAMRLSSHIFESDPKQFASQLVGRLMPYNGAAAVRDFSQAMISGAPRPWLQPMKPALQPPGTGLRLTIYGQVGFSAVAVTPDSQRAVSASDDRTLKVWELESGHERRTLSGHTGRVNAVAVTPDGRRAVSASSDRTLKVWELESGRELQTLSGHTRGVSTVAVTAGGRRAVSASDDRTLMVWELESGRKLQTLSGHTGWVTAVAVTSEAASFPGPLTGRSRCGSSRAVASCGPSPATPARSAPWP
jgi:hypothetical protein